MQRYTYVSPDARYIASCRTFYGTTFTWQWLHFNFYMQTSAHRIYLKCCVFCLVCYSFPFWRTFFATDTSIFSKTHQPFLWVSKHSRHDLRVSLPPLCALTQSEQYRPYYNLNAVKTDCIKQPGSVCHTSTLHCVSLRKPDIPSGRSMQHS